ncbi:hypothetical protein HMSSN139_10490 [Paenibacillus sp. HMSSN-139]|nr:hypothetical protein HMSSN139_10490 [Paenibacillus sp. HMSSN-139]
MIPRKWRTRLWQERITAYCFLLPDLLGLFIFVFLPIVYAFYVSLHDWDALNPMKFIGFDNYVSLSKDADWWHSVGKRCSSPSSTYRCYFVFRSVRR